MSNLTIEREVCPACGLPMDMHGRVACDAAAAQRTLLVCVKAGCMNRATDGFFCKQHLAEERHVEHRTSNQEGWSVEQLILRVRRLEEIVARLDRPKDRPADETSAKPEHVCGLQGFGRGKGSENDVCPACETTDQRDKLTVAPNFMWYEGEVDEEIVRFIVERKRIKAKDGAL